MNGLMIRPYKRLNPRLFSILYRNFTLQGYEDYGGGSGIRSAMEENRILRVFVAFDNKRIIGWSVVYRGFYGHDDVVYSIGVYVPQTLRHKGIGYKLKLKAMKWAVRNKLTTFWYDHKGGWTSYMVMPEDIKIVAAPDMNRSME